MSRTHMRYKVKHQGLIVAQFATASLAIHFVNSIPQKDFVINYENRKDIWDTAKQGTPFLGIIQGIVKNFNAESDARFNAKMEKFRINREGITA